MCTLPLISSTRNSHPNSAIRLRGGFSSFTVLSQCEDREERKMRRMKLRIVLIIRRGLLSHKRLYKIHERGHIVFKSCTDDAGIVLLRKLKTFIFWAESWSILGSLHVDSSCSVNGISIFGRWVFHVSVTWCFPLRDPISMRSLHVL